MSISISLVVPTLGRGDELLVLLESLFSPTEQADTIVGVDQTLDDRLVGPVCEGKQVGPLHIGTESTSRAVSGSQRGEMVLQSVMPGRDSASEPLWQAARGSKIGSL